MAITTNSMLAASLTNMQFSHVGDQITVKVPVAAIPDAGSPLPFTITSWTMPTPTTPVGAQTVVNLDSVIPSAAVDGFRSYTISASPTASYMLKVGTPNGDGPASPYMYPGDSFELQPVPHGGSGLVFKNLDTTAPQLVSITSLSSYNSANPSTPVEVPAGNADGKLYYVAKFSEGVTGVSNQSFNVSFMGGVPYSPQNVMPLWLTTGNILSTTSTGAQPAASALHLVSVPGSGTTPEAISYAQANTAVTLKMAPTILSVQEMNAPPTDTGSQFGTSPTGANAYWLKVTLDGSADQFLSQNPRVPTLEFGLPGNSNSIYGPYPITVTPPGASYVAAGTNPGVLYLGFNNINNVVPLITESPISIKFQTTGGSYIIDRAGNSLVSSATVTTPKFLDATGEPVFSKWGDDTTTISDTSLRGYANGASFGTTAYKANEPSYFTDGKPLEKDANGNPTYDSNGDRIGMDTIDLSGIKSSPIIINANKGEAYVYVDGKAAVLDVSDYDRYILNDRFKGTDGKFVLGNEFYGTVDSEYVVVGSGGDNYLVAGNQGATDISSNVTVKNYQFNSTGIVAETDFVDYSQLATGITVNLGDRANAAVSVIYKDGPTPTQSDTLFGFEGVVGSRGNDDIFGSNIGNALAGGAGNDELRGYTAGALGDKLYNQTYKAAEYGIKGTQSYKEAQFLVDSSDILYGGAGADRLYGGAGRDMLIDLGNAEMWGSDTGRNADGTVNLRSSADKSLAENDIFWVRGDGAETATINNFHLSKDGTGLAGRSNSANDAIMFSIDTTKLFGATAMTSMYASFGSDEALYNYVYSRLTFEQIHNNVTNDLELVVNFKKDNSSQEIKVGSTIIADIGTMLNDGANRAEVVELKWLSKGDDPLYLFNPKIDMDLTEFVQADEFGPSMNIAVALELLQAGTVRGTNDYGVMAAKLSDNDLNERVYNPGDKDDRILGTTSADSYEYIVQQFTATPPATITPPGETPTPPAVITNQVGRDAIFDTGGNDVLMFESASLQDLVFSAVKVGRESKANSLKVVHKQNETLDDGDVKNEGEVVWQGHYKEGGRQAAEVLKIKGGEFEIAQAVYEYNAKGYAKGGPEITASNARDVIMVGQGNGDKFVFDFDAVASVDKTQTARIAGFGQNDKIDISKFGDLVEEGGFTKNLADQDSTVRLEFDTGFVLNLSFQGAVTDADLQFAIFGTSP